MASLSLENVKKVYPGGVEAVKGVSLQVPDRAFVVLVGPSGCGKSTLLRMIAGLETITSGTVRIGDRVVNDVEPANRDIAMVFQNYALYPHMKVFDNMAYGLRNRGMGEPEVKRRVEEAARLLEIGQLLDRKPRQLSGGQRQRVAMGRAIVRQPAAFLFDEPLSNLDAKLRVQMRVEIKKLQRDIGTTSIYVTHDQVEAMTMADILVVMNAGTAEQIDTPREIYQRPATTFVASFIGSPSMNFLPATLTGDGKGVIVGGVSIALAEGTHVAASTITVGVRPEEIVAGADGATHTVAVDVIEHLGADTIVHGKLVGDGANALTVRLVGYWPLAPGEMLPVALHSRALHGFDTTTGRRL
jgi:sn-glycerol 3-phosphate transport system ATP-binding protein